MLSNPAQHPDPTEPTRADEIASPAKLGVVPVATVHPEFTQLCFPADAVSSPECQQPRGYFGWKRALRDRMIGRCRSSARTVRGLPLPLAWH